MIDLHCHVLPGLDHGARDWEEAIEMCRIAAGDGISILAATPHVSEDFPNSAAAIHEATAELRERVAAAGIALDVVEGGDYHVDPDLGPHNVVTLNANGRYFLLEFPYHIIPPGSDRFVRTLIGRGLVPVVTHPERIASLLGNDAPLGSLVIAGGLVQITADSLTGAFGREARRLAVNFLEKGWVHLIASDGHWARERTPVLSKGLAAAAEVIGEEEARALVTDNPRAVIAGAPLPA